MAIYTWRGSEVEIVSEDGERVGIRYKETGLFSKVEKVSLHADGGRDEIMKAVEEKQSENT